MQEDGIVLLGSPIGSKVFEKQAIEERINKVRELCSRLPLMKDAQSEYVLLRSCLFIPKIMFTRHIETRHFCWVSENERQHP